MDQSMAVTWGPFSWHQAPCSEGLGRRFLQIHGVGNLRERISKQPMEAMGLVNRMGHGKEGADTSPLAELRQECYEPIFPKEPEREGPTAFGIRSWVASSQIP